MRWLAVAALAALAPEPRGRREKASAWPFAHVYVANLVRDPDRLQTARHALEGAQVRDYEVFAAVDGQDPRQVPETALAAMHHVSVDGQCGDVMGARFESRLSARKWGSQERQGTAGCYLTHLRILKDALRRGYASVLVFEDDLDPVADALRGPPELKQLPQEWDMLYLGWTKHIEGMARKEQATHDRLSSRDCPKLPKEHALCRLRKPVLQQTHAIAFNAKALPKLVEFLEAALADGHACAIDQMYKAYLTANPDLGVYAFTSPLFNQLTAEKKLPSHLLGPEAEAIAQKNALRGAQRDA